MPVAGRGLDHLRNQRLSVEQQQTLYRAATISFNFDDPSEALIQLVSITKEFMGADRAALPTASLARTVFAEAYGLPWRKNGA